MKYRICIRLFAVLLAGSVLIVSAGFGQPNWETPYWRRPERAVVAWIGRL